MELSILMPCLNEAETLARCIEKAKLGICSAPACAAKSSLPTTAAPMGSQAIAENAAVRLVPVKEKGYGSALNGGVRAASGQWIILWVTPTTANMIFPM